MARNYYTFKKYEDNRKKTDRFLKAVHRKSVSDWRKASRKRETARNKRLREYERERQQREKAREKERAKHAAEQQESLTDDDFLTGCLFLAIVGFLIFLIVKVGFLLTVLISLILLTIVLVINTTIESKKAEYTAELEQHTKTEPDDADRSNQIPYLKSLLGEIRKHQTIANTSNDPAEVKKHLDCLLGVMDEISTFDNATLKQAGMTKANYESARAELLEAYDAMIAQAGRDECED